MAAIMLGTVFGQIKRKYQLKLLAGSEGLHRSLRWIYFSEDIGAEDFVRGGELVVFTGFSFESRAEFEAYVQMLIRKNCCGVIINVGKYLFEEDISGELQALCEEKRFPVIAMPWKYHLTDILQEFSRHIFFHEQEQAQLSYVFQTLLEEERPFSQEDETRLLANHFNPQGRYRVCVVSSRGEDGNKLPEHLVEDVCALVEHQIGPAPERSCVLSFRGNAVAIFHEAAAAELDAQMERLLGVGAEWFPGLQLFCALGSEMQGVESVKRGYDQACAAMFCAPILDTRIIRFDEMEEFQLFYSCRDRTILEQFAAILLPIRRYESQSGEEFSKTLRLYLEFDGSIHRVSEELHCHRNTVSYRINKVEELLQMDVEDRQTRFQLQLAFFIEDYLSLRPAEE